MGWEVFRWDLKLVQLINFVYSNFPIFGLNFPINFSNFPIILRQSFNQINRYNHIYVYIYREYREYREFFFIYNKREFKKLISIKFKKLMSIKICNSARINMAIILNFPIFPILCLPIVKTFPIHFPIF